MFDAEEKYVKENALEIVLYESPEAKFSKMAPAQKPCSVKACSVIVIDDEAVDDLYDAMSEYLSLDSKQAAELIKMADVSEYVDDLLEYAYENKSISDYEIYDADL